MSYIRCLSNPENLYIWGGEKQIYIAKGGNKTLLIIPQKIFEGLIKKYHRNFGDNTKYKGAEIKEIFVKTNKLYPKKLWKIIGKYEGNFQMRLSYGDWHIDMWLVTWEYIVNNTIRRYKK